MDILPNEANKSFVINVYPEKARKIPPSSMNCWVALRSDLQWGQRQAERVRVNSKTLPVALGSLDCWVWLCPHLLTYTPSTGWRVCSGLAKRSTCRRRERSGPARLPTEYCSLATIPVMIT